MEAAMKMGAACVMTAASAWGGKLLAGAQQRRAEALREAVNGVRRLNIEMLERRMPLKDALLAADGLFSFAAREMEGGAPPGEAWLRAEPALRERGAMLDCAEESDRTALRRLFEGLGGGGLQAQRLVLSEAEEELTRLHQRAQKRREEQGRLYASLGALGGLALALLLL